VACLQALDADRLLQIEQKIPVRGPVQDGVDLTAPVRALVAAGKTAPNVPILRGATTEDINSIGNGSDIGFRPCRPDTCTRDDFVGWARAVKREMLPRLDVEALVEAYTAGDPPPQGGNFTRWYWAIAHAGVDATMHCPNRKALTLAHELTGVDTYLYQFSHAPHNEEGRYPNLAFHASEIPCVFHVLWARGPDAANMFVKPEEKSLSDAIVAYWSCFAATGDPNRCDVNSWAAAYLEDLPRWPAFTLANGAWMEFSDAPILRPHLKKAKCDTWNRAGIWENALSPPRADGARRR